MKRIVLSDHDLRQYSDEHLWYEVWMFFETGPIAESGGGGSPAAWNVSDLAALESFVIHLRNLLDFFYPDRAPRDDDVIAADYFDEGQMPSNFTLKSDLLDKAETRAH